MKSSVKIYNTGQLDTKVGYIGGNEIPIRIYHNENLYESGDYVSIALSASTGGTISNPHPIQPSPLGFETGIIIIVSGGFMQASNDNFTTIAWSCSATADSGYYFYHWELNGEEMADGELYPITQDTTINAIFVEEITISLPTRDGGKFMNSNLETVSSIVVPNTKIKFISSQTQYRDGCIAYWQGGWVVSDVVYKLGSDSQILKGIDNAGQEYEFPANGYAGDVIFPDAWPVTPIDGLYGSQFMTETPSKPLNLLCEDEAGDPYLNAYWTLDYEGYDIASDINIPVSSLYVATNRVSSSPYIFSIFFKNNLGSDYWYANIYANINNHSLNRIEYRRANGTVVGTFDLTTAGDILPLTGGIQSGDKVVMVMDSIPPGPSTFTFGSAPVATDFTSQVQIWHSGCNVPDGQVNYTLAGDDGYYYCTVAWTLNWSDMNLECIKLDNTMTPVANNSVATSGGWNTVSASTQTFRNGSGWAMSYWTQYVDSSITDTQTLGEWIYNQLQ